MLGRRLARQIGVMLALKIVALATLSVLLFGADSKRDVTPGDVGNRFFGTSGAGR